MQPLSILTNTGIAKYNHEHSLGPQAQRQTLPDPASATASLTNLVDTLLPQADNGPGDLAHDLHVLRSLHPGQEDIAVYDGNSQSGQVTQQVTNGNGQGYRHTEFTPDYINSLQVGPNGANLMHIDRKNPAQSYVDVLNQPWQVVDGRPGAAPAAPAPVSNLTTTSSGLQYAMLEPGSGPAAEKGHPVLVDYSGWLTDGTRFDSSLGHPVPFEFSLGAGQVIKGWDEGVEGMLVGEKRRIAIPANLGYGDQATGPIPANSPLIFDVKLLATQ